MRTRPGANLIRGLVVLAALSLAAAFWAPIIWLVGFAAIALSAAAIYDRHRLRPMLDEITVIRSMPHVIGRDVAFSVRLVLTNKARSAVRLEVRDERPPDAEPRLVIHQGVLNPAEPVEFAAACRMPHRGRRTFGPVWIRLASRLNLVETQRSVDCPGAIKVLPETFASREYLKKDLGAEVKLLDRMQRARQHGVGSEFESLNPFRYGDDPRRIDWRATARQRQLIVRRFQVERHRDVMIIIDSGRLMGTQAGPGTKFDYAVDAALNLARVALHSGDRCGIAAYDRQVRGFLPPISGAKALNSLVECIFDLGTQWHESEFTPMLAELRARRAKRTLLVVISDVNDAETSKRLCASLQQLQRQHLLLFAALRTPRLQQIVDQPVATVRDAAKKAVVFRLLHDRARALHALRRGGVHVLDVAPTQLTVPLINQFVELRQRDLL